MPLNRTLSFFVLLVWLGGCGGGSSNATPPSLSSITVTPASVTLWAGLGTEHFTATGHYTDGSSKDLTASVVWSSTSPSVASVTGGTATPLAGGTTSVKATSGGVSGASQVTVVGLANAYITPSGPTLSLTGSPSGVQLSLTGVWTDGKTQDVTSQVNWSSSDITVAGVNGTGYVSRAANAGYATISANWAPAVVSTAVSVTTQTVSASNLSGTYVFLLNGPGPDFLMGQFTADGNSAISGQLVAASGSNIISMPAPFIGTYTVFPDGRGDITIVPSSPLTTTHLRFALGSTGDQGRMILFDPAKSTAMTGAFQRQVGPFSAQSLQGTYVFKLGGTDSSNQPQAIVGMLTTDENGQVVSGVADWNDNTVVNNGNGRNSPLNVTGSYGVSNDGHGGMTLTIGSAELHFAMFVVSNGLFRLLCTDPNNRLLGQFERQNMPDGGFQTMDGSYTFLLENGGRAGVFGMGGELDLGPMGSMGGWATLPTPVYADLEPIQGVRSVETNGRGTLDVDYFVRQYTYDKNFSFATYMVSPTRMYMIETDTQTAYAGLAQGTGSGILGGTYVYMAGSLKVASGTESAALALLDAATTDPQNGTFSGIADVNLPASGMPGSPRVFGSIVATGTFSADVSSGYTNGYDRYIKWMASFAGYQNFTFYINSNYQALMFGYTVVNDNPDIEGWLVKQ